MVFFVFMALDRLPPQLHNADSEHCFESCLGLTLAHFGKLGGLTLTGIVAEMERPGEEYFPMERGLAWLGEFGLKVEYVEVFAEEDPDFISSLIENGIIYTPVIPDRPLLDRYLKDGRAVLTQVDYSGEGEPDHIAYVQSTEDYQTNLIDPDMLNPLVMHPIEELWGEYPNLIVIG
jgi:hypothetical protein